MTSYLAGKTGVVVSQSVSVKKAGFGTRLGCPNACPEGYRHDEAMNVCVLNSAMPVGPVLPVVMGGKKFGRAW